MVDVRADVVDVGRDVVDRPAEPSPRAVEQREIVDVSELRPRIGPAVLDPTVVRVEPLVEVYERLAAASGAVPVADPSVVLAVSLVAHGGDGRVGEQELMMVADSAGAISEVTTGELTERHRLSETFGYRAIDASAASLDSAAAMFGGLHPLFADRPANEGEQWFRATTLANSYDVRADRIADSEFEPRWLGVAATPSTIAMAVVNATTGETEFVSTFATSEFPLLADIYFDLGVWDYLQVAAKVAGVALQVYFVATLIGVGAAGVETGVVPVLALIGIALTVVGIVATIVDIVLELTAEDERAKLLEAAKKVAGAKLTLEKVRKDIADSSLEEA
ncbi:MAG: hypothetical protein AAFP84_12030, partial [Actinomycetota bacterium]